MLRILTYNIHKGMSMGNRHLVLPSMRDNLRKVGADVILLQEIHGAHSSRRKFLDDWNGTNQLEYLADAVWPHHAYGRNAVYQGGHHGNAILSKYPIIEWENIDVSLMRHASRSLLHAVIAVPGVHRRVHIVCVHLGLFVRERTRQLATLMQRIDTHVPADEPVIIAGDFNDWREHLPVHLEHGLREISHTVTGDHAKTFPAWMPVLKLDRVYYRHLDLVSYQCLNAMPWRKMSDHIPLLAQFALAV